MNPWTRTQLSNPLSVITAKAVAKTAVQRLPVVCESSKRRINGLTT